MFQKLQLQPLDAMLSLTEACKRDPNPEKMDLGIGVYQNEFGYKPVLGVVKSAEAFLKEHEETKAYTSPFGNAAFVTAMLDLLLGADRSYHMAPRLASCQTVGGSGAIRLGIDIAKATHPASTIWISTPTWPNYTPLLESSGMRIRSHPYFDTGSMTLLFGEMLEFLKANAAKGDILVLQGCCHNPTGADLSPGQWNELADVLLERGIVPFLDLAYFGLGLGFDGDTYGLRKIVDTLPEVMIAATCSKNFAIYRERVGLFAALCDTQDTAGIVRSNIGLLHRGLISTPPSHGAAVVTHILEDRQLRRQWWDEVGRMRSRVDSMRHLLVREFAARAGGEAYHSALVNGVGLFSLFPLTSQQIHGLWQQSIYPTTSGRINISGFDETKIGAFVDAVLSSSIQTS